MKLPEIKAILKTVSASTKLSEKEGNNSTKQTILFEIPARNLTDDWGNTKEIKAELFQADIINNKVDSKLLESLVGKKIVITQSYLNSYTYLDEKNVTQYGKSITVTQLKEFK